MALPCVDFKDFNHRKNAPTPPLLSPLVQAPAQAVGIDGNVVCRRNMSECLPVLGTPLGGPQGGGGGWEGWGGLGVGVLHRP